MAPLSVFLAASVALASAADSPALLRIPREVLSMEQQRLQRERERHRGEDAQELSRLEKQLDRLHANVRIQGAPLVREWRETLRIVDGLSSRWNERLKKHLAESDRLERAIRREQPSEARRRIVERMMEQYGRGISIAQEKLAALPAGPRIADSPAASALQDPAEARDWFGRQRVAQRRRELVRLIDAGRVNLLRYAAEHYSLLRSQRRSRAAPIDRDADEYGDWMRIVEDD